MRTTQLWNSPKSKAYSDEWYTPPQMVKSLGEFDLDPCAARDGEINHAKENWRPPVNGLMRDWFGRVWLNPPFSKMADWMPRLVMHGNGIALMNAWPERVWFQAAVRHVTGVLWLRHRVNFIRPGNVKTNGCIGNVLMAFGPDNAQALQRSNLPGIYFDGPPQRIPHE